MIIIEHNLHVIKSADWIIDMGPEGGQKGGMVVAEGTPEDLAKRTDTPTGQFLKNFIKQCIIDTNCKNKGKICLILS